MSLIRMLGEEPFAISPWESPIFNTINKNFNYEVEDSGNSYLVQVDLPGVKKEDVNIKLNNGVLNVTAERKGKKATTFKKSFKLPSMASDEITAELNDGVLTLTIPKAEESKAKTIQIQSNSGAA